MLNAVRRTIMIFIRILSRRFNLHLKILITCTLLLVCQGWHSFIFLIITALICIIFFFYCYNKRSKIWKKYLMDRTFFKLWYLCVWDALFLYIFIFDIISTRFNIFENNPTLKINEIQFHFLKRKKWMHL